MNRIVLFSLIFLWPPFLDSLLLTKFSCSQKLENDMKKQKLTKMSSYNYFLFFFFLVGFNCEGL